MNWINENKFLAGFFGFMIVGIGALGFLLYQAMGDYDTVHQEYLQKSQTLSGLRGLVPTRNEENLEKYKAQKTALAAAIHTLEQNVSAIQFPLNASVTKEAFQDELRAAVNKVQVDAKTKNVKLPEKFAFGFDQYLTSPPAQAAAAPLDRELKAVEFIVNELVDTKVESIASTAGATNTGGGASSGMVRAPLPEERGAKSPGGLVEKSRVDISFVTDQSKLRKILNDLAETKQQFYIVRLITVKNQDQKQLTKHDALSMRTTTGGVLNYVLGNEKLEVALNLEIVNFNPPQK